MRLGGCLTLPKFQRTHSRTNFLFFYSNVRFQKSDPSIKTTARHSFESERMISFQPFFSDTWPSFFHSRIEKPKKPSPLKIIYAHIN